MFLSNVFFSFFNLKFVSLMQDASTENKLRLLIIYALVYPEKFEGDKGLKLMQVTVNSNSCFLYAEFHMNHDPLSLLL